LSDPLLRADGLACVRGGRLVFEGVSFALAPGEALLLRGPNGAGKSSLLRLLAGFVAPRAGAVWWHGRPAFADPAAHRVRLHLIGHGNALKGALSVRENLRFAVALAGAPLPLVEHALAHFELTALADVPAAYLSAGQQRRLALARVLAAARPLWLLDEPDAGLDAASRGHLTGAVSAHRATGGIAVIASHRDLGLEATQVLELAA
jgi:heme exporter protein A